MKLQKPILQKSTFTSPQNMFFKVILLMAEIPINHQECLKPSTGELSLPDFWLPSTVSAQQQKKTTTTLQFQSPKRCNSRSPFAKVVFSACSLCCFQPFPRDSGRKLVGNSWWMAYRGYLPHLKKTYGFF